MAPEPLRIASKFKPSSPDGNTTRGGLMDFERTTMAQFADILRLLELKRSDRNIARALKCRRSLVAQIRKGELTEDELKRLQACEQRVQPAWTFSVDWEGVEKDIR